MKLLIRSTTRHLREHRLQTFFTMLVTILVTGMLSVLFHFSSGFQDSLRTYALEKNGTYHYKYYTNVGTGVAELFCEMEKQFREDDWFSETALTEDGGQLYLTLTVAHPGFFTSRTMEQKFNALKERCYVQTGEIFYLGQDHNYELLAASFDLSRENGIYSFLLVFLVLLAVITGAAVLTLGAVFRVSAMQREREIALLSGIGADRRQICGMILAESAMYCLFSIPAGFLFGICVYRKLQVHFDNVIFSLFRFPPTDFCLSIPYSVALTGCAVSVILLSGLTSAVRASHISPIALLRRTKEIQVSKREARRGYLPGKNPYEPKTAASAESWLAGKSHRRFQRRNRPILIMLAVTLTLCFVWDGFRQYATQTVRMSFDTASYNYSVDLYGDDPAELTEIASGLKAASNNRLKTRKEAFFCLHAPYPFSAFGESTLHTDSGMLPDVSLLCIEEAEFRQIRNQLGISEEPEGLWGIFIDTEHAFWSNGVMVKGRPFHLDVGEQISLYNSWEPEAEAFSLTVAGVCDARENFMDTAASTRMLLLVPERVFFELEEKRAYREWEPGIRHISLRGTVEDGTAFGKIAAEQTNAYENITCIVSDSVEQARLEMAGIDSFQFLCAALIITFVMISICGNFTISWASGRAREKESATLLSVGMSPKNLEKMRLLELLQNVRAALLPGIAAGICAYQLIYLIYASEYRIYWRFPLAGLLLGMVSLTVSMGTANIALQISGGKKELAEQLRTEA